MCGLQHTAFTVFMAEVHNYLTRAVPFHRNVFIYVAPQERLDQLSAFSGFLELDWLPGQGQAGVRVEGQREVKECGSICVLKGTVGRQWVFLKRLWSAFLSPSSPVGPLCPWWGLWLVSRRETCPPGSLTPLPFLWTFEPYGKTLLPGTVCIWLQLLSSWWTFWGQWFKW